MTGIFALDVAIELRVLQRLESLFGGPLRGMGPRVRRALGFEALEDRFLKSATLAFTFSDDAAGQGPLGDQSWTAGEIVEFGQTELGLEPGTTSGSFSSVFDLNEFGIEGATIDAFHLVTEDITVAGIRLARGSLLFSTDNSATFAEFTATPSDVVLFAPDGTGPDHSGTFSLLIDGSDIGINADLNAVSLVTADVQIGGRSFPAGTFLLSGGGVEPVGDSPSVAVTSRDIFVLEATTLGSSTTSGATSLLVDGSDIGVDRAISAVHIVSHPGFVADRVVNAGSLLLSLAGGATSIGSNGIEVTEQDVFELAITQAGVDTIATASLWFEGSDVRLTTDAQLDGIALTAEPTSNSPPTTTGIADLTVSQDAPNSVIDLFSAFDDAEDSDADLTYTISDNSDPSLFDQLSVTETGILTLDYATGAFGTSEITVRATDTAGAFVETVFEVTVNSPPTTTGIADFHFTSQTSTVLIDLFSAFDDREDSDSELIYTIVRNTDPSLLSEIRLSEETGLLQLGSAVDAYGTTEITLRATDSDGDYVETSFVVIVDIPSEPLTPSETTGHSDSPDPTPISPEVHAPQMPAWLDVDTIVQTAPEDKQAYVPPSDNLHTVVEVSTDSPSRWSSQDVPFSQTSQEIQKPSTDEEQAPANTDKPQTEGESAQRDTSPSADRTSEPEEQPTQARQAISDQRSAPVAPAPQLATDAPPVDRPQAPQASDAVLAQWNEVEEPNDLTTLWNALDDLASETSQAARSATGERLVVAGIGGVLCVGYVMWVFPRGCLLVLTGTSAPLWKNWDLLNVLPARPTNRKMRGEASLEDETLISVLG